MNIPGFEISSFGYGITCISEYFTHILPVGETRNEVLMTRTIRFIYNRWLAAVFLFLIICSF